MVKVKICGLTRVEDARAAYEAGADMVGVIVNAKVPTPRNLDYRSARKILERTPSGMEKVVVGMPRDLSEGLEMIEELDPDYLQIHSNPSLTEMEELKEITEKELIITISVPSEEIDYTDIIMRAKKIAEVSDCILLDTKGSAGRGGTGKIHDWSVSRKVRHTLDTPVFLAGGLNPLNVGRAIEEVRPYGVDVASGVETKPGVKDAEKIRVFVKQSKRYE